MSFSLIITDILTTKGYKTFTMRWDEQDIITWNDIYEYVSQKSGIKKNYIEFKVNHSYIKYRDIENFKPFDLHNFIFYNSDGNPTKTGLLNSRVNLGKLYKASI